jgi:hypothetical protein
MAQAFQPVRDFRHSLERLRHQLIASCGQMSNIVILSAAINLKIRDSSLRCAPFRMTANTNSQSNGGTGVSPVQAQAKAWATKIAL